MCLCVCVWGPVDLLSDYASVQNQAQVRDPRQINNLMVGALGPSGGGLVLAPAPRPVVWLILAALCGNEAERALCSPPPTSSNYAGNQLFGCSPPTRPPTHKVQPSVRTLAGQDYLDFDRMTRSMFNLLIRLSSVLSACVTV